VTLTQLKVFLTVARLGSVKAAALSLSVTEPAVSGAVAVLRRELGDPLFERSHGGVALTRGGQRLAASAAEILGLAEEARQRIRDASDERPQLRVAATASVAEYVVPWLLESFRRSQPNLDASTLAVPGSAFAEVLKDRRADVAIGPRAAPERGVAIDSTPFLRIRLVVVAPPTHPLGGEREVAMQQLGREPWLLGPAGLDQSTLAGVFLTRLGVTAASVSAFPSGAAALEAVGEGQGVSIAFAHVVGELVKRRSLAILNVQDARLDGYLYASALSAERRSPTTSALCRFVTTAEAAQSVLTRSSKLPMARFKPAVHVTLWS
jgi:LysR family transcriptional regulator, low CO2-responsive transcriptional regulator